MDKHQPQTGQHYPGSTGEFQAWFGTDDDCLDYLDWVRWPNGFVCPQCGHRGGWAVAEGGYKCAACGRRTAVTARTLFDRRRSPLTVWFTACWMFASQKDGVSALSLQRALDIGSYQTAWAMLHRLRSVLIRPGRDRLTGTVEVDETYIGGEEPGLRGGRAKGKKALVGVAIEVKEPRGYGRCRMVILRDGSAASLHPFVTDHVEPGSRVITDGWQGYAGIDKLGYTREPRSQRAARPAARILGSCCRGCTGSRPWLSAGSSARIKAGSMTRTYRATSTNSCSGSTDEGHAAEAWSSTACLNSPSPTTRCATAASSPTHSRRALRLSHRGKEGTPRASTSPLRIGHGERSDLLKSPVRWITLRTLMHVLSRLFRYPG